jgi:hypothetical protein
MLCLGQVSTEYAVGALPGSSPGSLTTPTCDYNHDKAVNQQYHVQSKRLLRYGFRREHVNGCCRLTGAKQYLETATSTSE